MTYPNQPGNNSGGRNNRPNPFNPFGDNSNKPRNNGGPNGNNNAPRSFWQRPWLYIVLIVLILFFIFQAFLGNNTQTINTQDGMNILNSQASDVESATIVDNTQQVQLKLKNDFKKNDPQTGRERNYGKDVQFYYTTAQQAQVVRAVEKANPSQGWTGHDAQHEHVDLLAELGGALPHFLRAHLVPDEPYEQLGGRHARHGRQEERQARRRPDSEDEVLRRRGRRSCRTGGRGDQGLPQRTRPSTRRWAPASRAVCCCTALPAPARRCSHAPLQARPACRSTPWRVPTSSRCSWALAPRAYVTCSTRRRRMPRLSSSSTRSTP